MLPKPCQSMPIFRHCDKFNKQKNQLKSAAYLVLSGGEGGCPPRLDTDQEFTEKRKIEFASRQPKYRGRLTVVFSFRIVSINHCSMSALDIFFFKSRGRFMLHRPLQPCVQLFCAHHVLAWVCAGHQGMRQHLECRRRVCHHC